MQVPHSARPPIQVGADPNELLTRKKTAQLMKLSEHTLAVWSCSGRYDLPYIKIGTSVRYRVADINAWLEARSEQSHPAGTSTEGVA